MMRRLWRWRQIEAIRTGVGWGWGTRPRLVATCAEMRPLYKLCTLADRISWSGVRESWCLLPPPRTHPPDAPQRKAPWSPGMAGVCGRSRGGQSACLARLSGPQHPASAAASSQALPLPRVRMVRSGKPGRAAVDVARIHAEERRDAGRLR